MATGCYKITDQGAMYFVSFAVVGWVDNQPKIIYTPPFAAQKLEYIHNNPVEAGIVEKAEECIYSSARDNYSRKQGGLIKIEFLI